ncbi:uncharacterized protein LOC142172105 [Nicotiana tabacum]|uniref:Uncharacterized protein LOC142172105 n=1 Tax=Nicotiana tabacum TaxID=4097 RepID=A0AC58T418_TOBAC
MEFNKIMQIGSVDQYQERFEELTSYMDIINSLLNKTHFVSSFISGLKPELKPLVKLANPVTIMDAYEIAKLYEESFSALTALIPARNNQNLPYPRPLAITYPRAPQTSRPAQLPAPNQHLRITYPNQRAVNRAPLKPNIFEALRAQGLCYKCHEKYESGHQCKDKTLHAMEGVTAESEPEIEEFMDVPETLEEQAEEQAEVSLNMVMGLSSAEGAISTIKILGYAKKISLTILIDSGSTHSFIDPHVVKLLKLPLQPMTIPLRVVVANGQVMRCDQESPLFNWKMQNELFAFKIRLLKVGGCDMVLGMDWIDVVAPAVLHTRPHSLSFTKEGKMVTLSGVNVKPEVILVDTEALRRMLHCGTCEVITELSITFAGPRAKGEKEMNHASKRLLTAYKDVFRESTKLPPERDCDHVINLILAAQPFNLRPYTYSHDQNNAIESIVNDMLEAETLIPSQSSFASPTLLVKKKDST